MKRKAKKIGAPARKSKALGKKELKKVSGGIGGFSDGRVEHEWDASSGEWITSTRKKNTLKQV